jgi:hypothetical protein
MWAALSGFQVQGHEKSQKFHQCIFSAKRAGSNRVRCAHQKSVRKCPQFLTALGHSERA